MEFDIVAECFAAPHKRRIVPLVGNRSKIKLDFTYLPRRTNTRQDIRVWKTSLPCNHRTEDKRMGLPARYHRDSSLMTPPFLSMYPLSNEIRSKRINAHCYWEEMSY